MPVRLGAAVPDVYDRVPGRAGGIRQCQRHRLHRTRSPPAAVADPPVMNQACGAAPGSVWMLLGLAVLWLLIMALAVREFARVGAPVSARLLRVLTLASWPLLVLTLGIVIARFVVL